MNNRKNVQDKEKKGLVASVEGIQVQSPEFESLRPLFYEMTAEWPKIAHMLP